MTSYITITDAETDPSAPLTSELAKKWRDNPIAIAEGSTGAPKIAKKIVGGSASTVTITGLTDFSGVEIDFWATFPGGLSGGGDVNVSFSDDGTTYYGSTTVASGDGQGYTFGKVWVDFTTASLVCTGFNSGSTGAGLVYTTTTVSGLTNAVTRIRVSNSNAPASVSVSAAPNGGIL